LIIAKYPPILLHIAQIDTIKYCTLTFFKQNIDKNDMIVYSNKGTLFWKNKEKLFYSDRQSTVCLF